MIGPVSGSWRNFLFGSFGLFLGLPGLFPPARDLISDLKLHSAILPGSQNEMFLDVLLLRWDLHVALM
jgi:hypothetical protein